MLNILVQSIFVILIFSFFSCSSKESIVKKFSDGVYKGEVDKKGRKDGSGIIIWNDGSSYEGEFKKDLRHGTGLFTWSNGETYEGDYLNDFRTGKGIYRWPDDAFYKGSFLRGKRHGLGTFQTSSGLIYEGEWYQDESRKITNVSHTKHLRPKKYNQNSNIEDITPDPITDKSSVNELAIKNNSTEQDDKPPITYKTSTLSKYNDSLSSSFGISKNKPPVEESKSEESSLISAKESSDVSEDFQSPESNVVDGYEEKKPITPEPILSEKTNNKPGQQKEVYSKPIIWTGTVSEAEEQFTTDNINGIDTVKNVQSKIPFTGKMQILNEKGTLLGEVNLLNGQLHGEEIILDESGVIVERYLWEKGVEIN